MNQATRRTLNRLAEQLEEIQSELENIAELELEKFENMPEGLQYSDQGQALEEAGDTLKDAAHELLDLLDTIKTAAE